MTYSMSLPAKRWDGDEWLRQASTLAYPHLSALADERGIPDVHVGLVFADDSAVAVQTVLDELHPEGAEPVNVRHQAGAGADRGEDHRARRREPPAP